MKGIKRHEWLIVLLNSPGVHNGENEPIDGSIRIMKALFLMRQEIKEVRSGFYKFAPYLYGPYNLEVYSTIEHFILKGVISETLIGRGLSRYRLTYNGRAYAKRILEKIPHNVQTKIKEIKSEVNKRSFLELLEYVYAKYPKFAKKSVVAVRRKSS